MVDTSMKKEKALTQKDRDIISFFLSNGNKPAIQKQISIGAKVSVRHLGDLHDGRELKKEGRLTILMKKKLLDCKLGIFPCSGSKKFFYLRDDTNAFKQIAKTFLNTADTLLFIKSDYTQRMITKYVFDDVSKKFNINLSGGGNLINLYLFSWDNVPGDDSERLLRFLREDLNTDWVENAEISKSNDDKTIRIFKDDNFAEIFIDDNMKNATLKTDNGEIHHLNVKEENGMLNIYNDLIKRILTMSPSVLEYVLTDPSKENRDEKKSQFGKFLFGRSRSGELDTLAFFSILFYADIVKYPGLAQTAGDIRRNIDQITNGLVMEEYLQRVSAFDPTSSKTSKGTATLIFEKSLK